MNADIVRLTFRQLAGKRRTVFMALVALLPALLAVAFRVSGEGDAADWTSNHLLAGMIITVFLPLASLVFGTAIFGTEIDDGTAVYLLSRPLPRYEILLSKLAVAWVVTTVFVTVSASVAGVIAFDGAPGWERLLSGFVVGVTIGSLAYCTAFVLLSLMTGRAFVAGLFYVFIWEGLLTSLFTGVRIFSIREASLGIAAFVADADPLVFDAELGGLTAALVAVAAIATTGWLAVRRLERFEMGEAG